jgi:hypothetical protein
MEDAETTELEIVVTPRAPIAFNTNFQEIKKDLKKKLSKYKGLQVTDANFEDCKFIQKQCVTTRTLLEARQKEVIRAYIDLPKDALKKDFSELLNLVAEVENNIKAQMDVFEEERKAELTTILNGYVKKYQAEYKLAPKYLSSVQLKKSYFNKTAKEAETRADIKAQFEEAKKEQAAYESDVALIRSTIGDNKTLNAEHWVSQLEYRSASALVMDIKAELTRLEEVVQPSAGAVKIGAPVTIMSENAEEVLTPSKKKKKMKIELTYPENYGEIIKAFFDEHPEIKVVKL